MAPKNAKSRHPDGTVHFSLLRRLALSPAHYLRACQDALVGERKASRAMNVGTIAHHIVLGQRDGHRLVRFPGDKRVGAAWKEFETAHEGANIVTSVEWAAAEPIAEAVLRHPVARELVVGDGIRYEVPLRWSDGGVECGTDGLDVLGPSWLADLKTTPTAEPEAFKRHALRMHYHAQLTFYNEGCRAHGLDTSRGLFLIAAEVTPPYPVTVLKLTAEAEDLGARTCARWLERLRVCEADDHFPEYTQRVEDFDLPSWMAAALDDEEAA